MKSMKWVGLGLLIGCGTQSGPTQQERAEAAECGIELVVEEDYDLGEFEPKEYTSYEAPEELEPADVEVCEQLAEVQAQKARTNAIENATSALLQSNSQLQAKNSPRWEVYEHTCQGSGDYEVITTVSTDQLRYLVSAIIYSKYSNGDVTVDNELRLPFYVSAGGEVLYECDCRDDIECRLSLAFLD